jgi:hypothetical protein
MPSSAAAAISNAAALIAVQPDSGSIVLREPISGREVATVRDSEKVVDAAFSTDVRKFTALTCDDPAGNSIGAYGNLRLFVWEGANGR